MSGPCTLDALRPEDWEQVRAIYVEGIATGHATFETGAERRSPTVGAR